MSASAANFDVKERIRAYWARRCETFDLSPAHKLRTRAELEGWARLVQRLAPRIAGGHVLELACGTGEFTRVPLSLGCTVDALDFCEPMLARARAKHAGDGSVRFHLADAERSMMPDGRYDAVICRNLVWTLLDPAAAFADWRRVLKPGGALVIIDGDWVGTSWRARAFARLSRLVDRASGAPRLWDQSEHDAIMAHVHFRDGLTAARLLPLLAQTGFADGSASSLERIGRLQFAAASLPERLRLLANYERTFAVAAAKPGQAEATPRVAR